jgi:hypothetical protein
VSDAPIQFSYDRGMGIRTATYRGVIDDASLLRAYRELIVQPDFDPSAHDLADLRGVQKINLTPEGMRELGLLLSGGGSKPRPAQVSALAIVANTPVSFGLSRMYELLTESYLPKETCVFSELEEAVAWLRGRPRPN